MNDFLFQIAHAHVNAVIQKVAYQLGDLFEEYEGEAAVFFLAACQIFVNAVLPILDDRDKNVFKVIVEHSETTVMPRAFDPRKKGGATDGKA